MRYIGLFLALGMMATTVSSAYAECSDHKQQTASSGDASQAKLKRSEAGREG